MNISIIQDNILWELAQENLNRYKQIILNQVFDTQLIVLPEMFTTGFSMNAIELGSINNKLALPWMQEMARLKKCAVTGSVICEDKGQYYNRLYFVFPDETFKTYDKKHLFRMADEHLHYNSGKERLVIEYMGWKICPMICYDLRFPVFSRNKFNQKTGFSYDILLYVANWPEVRRSAWNCLLQARSHENLSYVIGVNRIGFDGNKKAYSGDSAIYDFKGEILTQSLSNESFVKTIFLDKKNIEDYRSKFNSLLDADSFVLT
jgi:omega-amidase